MMMEYVGWERWIYARKNIRIIRKEDLL